MPDAHRRKKNPELVRSQLIECASRPALECGLASVSVDAVAVAAGVTKGGFFHHSRSNQALIDAVFEHMLTQFGDAMDALMTADPKPHGPATRPSVHETLHQQLSAMTRAH